MNWKSALKRLLRWLSWGLATLVFSMVCLITADGLHRKTCLNPALEGRIVEIPGERIEFTRVDTTTLSLDTVRYPEVDPAYVLRPEDGHVHPHQEERFEILEGRARFLIGDREVVLAKGDVGVVPPNTVHHWMALDGQPVHVAGQFEPPLDTGAWFLTFHGHLGRGDMNLLQAAVISSEYKLGSPLPADPPPAVWRLLVKILAPVGRLLGYRAC